jgi:uncharacterized protein YyaL (SSP411 family)
LLDVEEFRVKGVATLHAFSTKLQQIPITLPGMIASAIYAGAPPLHIVIAGDKNSDDTRALLRAAHSPFIPYKTVLFADGGATQEELAKRAPWIAGMKPIDGKAAAYVCRNFACRQPVTTVEELEHALMSDE